MHRCNFHPSISVLAIILLGIGFLGTVGSAGTANAQSVVFEQPPDGTGNLLQSSWVDPDGSDSDWYTYDNFTLSSTADVNEVRWRGGYIHDAVYGRVMTFTVVFYESIAGGSQPHAVNPQLPEIYLAWYDVPDNAGETYAGTFGGKALNDYHYSLPVPFHAAGGVKYWIRVEAAQPVYPDWGIATGTGGDGIHYWFSTGLAQFNYGTGDAAFKLLASSSAVTAASGTEQLRLVVAPNPTPGPVGCFFALPATSGTLLTVSDVLGRCVRSMDSGVLPGGGHFVRWDGLDERGRPVSAGTYYIRLHASGRDLVRSAVILR